MKVIEPAGRGRQLLEALPGAARTLTEFAVDNPGQCAITVAGVIVATRVALNIVQPRTKMELLATAVIASVGMPCLLGELVRHDVISFRLRDGEGGYVPLLRALDEDRVHPAG